MTKSTCLILALLLFAGMAFAQTTSTSPTQRGQQYINVTIANGGTTSTAADLGACTPVAVVTPAALTSTAFTFTASFDGATYTAVYDTFGTAASATVAASRWVVLSPADWYGVKKMKIVAGSAEGAARTIQIVCRAQ